MGFGDIKMLAMVGAFLGWPGVVVTLFVASLAGSVVGLGGRATGRLEPDARLPFGTFLAPAAILSLFFAASWVERFLMLPR